MDETTTTGDAPAIEIDFGIGRLYIKGDENTSFEEVVEEFNDQKEEMNDTIKMLKEYDYELKEEYDGSAEGRQSSSSKTFG